MAVKQNQAPIGIGSVFSTLMRTTNNALSMIDNTMVAGERMTYIAASKASNLAEISDTADTFKLLQVKAELNAAITAAGVTYDAQGNMIFPG